MKFKVGNIVYRNSNGNLTFRRITKIDSDKYYMYYFSSGNYGQGLDAYWVNENINRVPRLLSILYGVDHD